MSIQFSVEQDVTLGSFTISNNGTPLPGSEVILLQPGSNHMPIDERNFALIPTSPLQPSSTYDVFFSATVNGNPFTASWSFTTTAVTTQTPTYSPNPATFTLGQTGELKISGGSGAGYSAGWDSASVLSLAWASSGYTLLITPKTLGSATITITDLGSQAVLEIPVNIISGPVPLSRSKELVAGWNLVNLSTIPIDTNVTQVTDGIKNQVISAWKWSANNWQVYLGPNQASDGGAAYAASKGFDALTTLTAGEGFWINATSATTLTYSGYAPADTAQTLTTGWNLLGLKTGEETPIGDVAYSLGRTIVSLWTWQESKWAVTLPKELDGGADYAYSKGFTVLQTIDPNQGFWANAE